MISNTENRCITKCAKIVALIGIISSVVTIILNLFTLTWWYIPMATVSILTYVLVYFGVEEKRSEYLTPALLILGIHLVVNIWITLGLIYIGYVLPDDIEYISHKIAEILNIHSTTFKIQLFYFITAFVVFLLAAYTLFSFIIIHKARMFLKENHRSSNNNLNADRPVYVVHANSADPCTDILEFPLIHSFRNPLQILSSNASEPEVVGYDNTAF